MRINQLEFLVAAEQYGSFSKAAKMLYVTQPAISAGIKELEEELGIRLFSRDKDGLRLTREGKAILPLAQSALESIAQIQALSRTSGRPTRQYRVAATRYMYSTILYTVGEEMKTIDPSLSVIYEMNDGADLLHSLMKNELECGIVQLFEVSTKEIEQFLRRNIVLETLWRDAFVFYCREGHPLALQEQVSIQDIFRYDIVSYLPVPEAPIMKLMTQYKFNNRIININDIIAVRKYLLTSDAIGMTPHAGFGTMVNDFGGGLVVLHPYDVLLDYDVCLAYRKHRLSETDKQVFRLIRESSKSLKPYPQLPQP